MRDLREHESGRTIGGTELHESDDLAILGVTFDSEMTLRCIFAHFSGQPLKDLVS